MLPARGLLPGLLQKVAQIAPGQGPAKLTHALYGLGSVMPTPTTLGVGRCVKIDWKAGNGFKETIMWTPEEAMKSKSFSDLHAKLIRDHCQSDAFMYKCTGQGGAFLTGRAIDLAVLAYLQMHSMLMDVIKTVVTRPSKGSINQIIKHVVRQGLTPKLVIAPAQIHAMVSRLEDRFQYMVKTMCFDTGAQALLVYAETHNQYMIGGGNKADVQVLGAAKGSGFGCDHRGTIMFAAMDTDNQIPGYNPTPVRVHHLRLRPTHQTTGWV